MMMNGCHERNDESLIRKDETMIETRGTMMSGTRRRYLLLLISYLLDRDDEKSVDGKGAYQMCPVKHTCTWMMFEKDDECVTQQYTFSWVSDDEFCSVCFWYECVFLRERVCLLIMILIGISRVGIIRYDMMESGMLSWKVVTSCSSWIIWM